MSESVLLQEVEKFFGNHHFGIDISRIKNLFYVIERADKLNTRDKKYVPHKTHEHEVEPTSFETICQICQKVYNRELDDGDKKRIYSEIVVACNDFEKRKINLWPRVAFYIVALDKLIA